jgi:hypothetical protein
MEVNEDQIIAHNPSLEDDKGSMLAGISTEVEMQLMNDEYMIMSDVLAWNIEEIEE